MANGLCREGEAVLVSDQGIKGTNDESMSGEPRTQRAGPPRAANCRIARPCPLGIFNGTASLIVLHCGDRSSMRGGRLRYGLISIGYGIGPAEGRTHV